MDLRRAFAIGIAEEWRDLLMPITPKGDVRFTIALHGGATGDMGEPIPALVICGRKGGVIEGKLWACNIDPREAYDEGREAFLDACAQIESALQTTAPTVIYREDRAFSADERARIERGMAEGPPPPINRIIPPTGRLERLHALPVEVQRAMHQAGIN